MNARGAKEGTDDSVHVGACYNLNVFPLGTETVRPPFLPWELPQTALTREKRIHIGPPAISCEITYRAGRNYWSSATT